VRVKGDIRCIRTTTFASGFSLRFPRVTSIRYDKKWSDLFTYAELKQIIEEGRPNVDIDMNERQHGARSKKRGRSAAPSTLLPAHLMPVDVSGVIPETQVFQNMEVYIVNGGRTQKEELYRAVRTRGGTTSEMWTTKVTHIVASKREGEKFTVACLKGDVYTVDWLKECIQENRIIQPRPRHRLHLTTSTWYGSETIDRYGDEYFVQCNEADIQALLYQVGDQTKRWETSEVPAIVALGREYPNLLKRSKYLTFRGCVFEIDDTLSGKYANDAEGDLYVHARRVERSNAESILRLYGGKVLTVESGRVGTHIVRVHDESVLEEYLDDGRLLVSLGWVRQQTTSSQI